MSNSGNAEADRERRTRLAAHVRKSSYVTTVSPSSVRALSTGLRSLDDAIGIGGLPKGRIAHLYGEAGSGKTTIALSMVAAVQRMKGTAAYFDSDRRFDPGYASRLGVDVNDLLLYQTDTAEQTLDAICALVGTDVEVFAVLDTLEGLVPKREFEIDCGVGDTGYLSTVRRYLRKIAARAHSSNSCVLILNHVTAPPLGAVFGRRTPYCGKVLEQRAALTIKATSRKMAQAARNPPGIVETKNVQAWSVTLEIIKNSVSPCLRTAEVTIMTEGGNHSNPATTIPSVITVADPID